MVVDLSDLTFADSSLMIDLAMLSRRLRITGRHIRVCNAQPQVWWLIEVVGLDRLPGVVAEPHAPAVA